MAEKVVEEKQRADLGRYDLEGDLARLKEATVAVVFDHARAGNNFFKRLFDQHPQVLSLTLVGYLYTRIINLFRGREQIEGREAYAWALEDSNIRRICQDLTPEIESDLIHIGENPSAQIDRGLVREVLYRTIGQREVVNRKDVLASVFLAYAIGTGRSVRDVRCVMLDAVSHNDLPDGNEQNRVLFRTIQEDNPRLKVIHLVRDPRANFASLKHLYVNRFGSMYPVRASKIWGSVWCNSVWLWILRYTAEGAKAMHDFGKKLGQHLFLLIRIEDVNSKFVETMQQVIAWLGVTWYEPWGTEEYLVTSCGSPWGGISAYIPRYNLVADGPFRNESEDGWRVCRPNPGLNEGWKKRIVPREIKIVEATHYEEMHELGYSFEYLKGPEDRATAVWWAMLPFSGEIPVRREWWLSKRRIDKRLAFLVVLPFSYVASRAMFFFLYVGGKLKSR
jgi:hypothetical protein